MAIGTWRGLRIAFATAIGIGVLAAWGASGARADEHAGDSGSSPRLIVTFAGDATFREERLAVIRAGGTIDQRLTAIDAAAVSPDRGVSRSDLTQRLEASNAVALVEPDYKLQASATTVDRYLKDGSLWGVKAIHANAAWDTAIGTNVVIAVIDTGISASHPDLRGNLWQNPAEGPVANGVDEDGNGVADDITGVDFVARDGVPNDENGHGTHVAGTIAAVGGNRRGTVGIAYGAKIMALKVLDRNGAGDVSGAIAAIDYAVQHGARVVNASWGGPDRSESLRLAIERAGAAGVVVAAAGGNAGADVADQPSYPASFDLPNLIGVAATNVRHRLADFSNYGAASLSIAAPGEDIWSTVGRSYESWSGTSMATPHVAGAAAILLSSRPESSAAEITTALEAGARRNPALQNLVGAGELDTAGALRALYGGKPPRAKDADQGRPGRFRLQTPRRAGRRARATRILVRWARARDDSGIAGYRIYVNGRQRGFTADPDGPLGPLRAGTRFTLSVRGGKHLVSVRAIDLAGHSTTATRNGKNSAAVSIR